MRVRLKKLNQQVVVITGASSGIGLATARLAARRGAKLVLAARSEQGLERLAYEITTEGGGQAIPVAADVGREEDVRRVADTAVRHFGGFDTWVNNAGVSVYGRIEEVALDDAHRLFQTDFWGVVHGSRVAVEHLRSRGGALVNLGSIVSDRALPLQGYYSAAKHAVQGFTDALRMELEEENAPVSVTLIKPSGIDTPFRQHAKNYMAVEPNFPPPVYAPETVAEAILHCAEHPERHVVIGGGGRAITAAGKLAPRFTDKLMERTMFKAQQTDHPDRDRGDGSLYRPAGPTLRERGGYEGHVFKHSAYTQAALHPALAGAMLVGGGLALAAVWEVIGERRHGPRRRTTRQSSAVGAMT